MRRLGTLWGGGTDKAVEQAADELYALPPSEFTRARDERAKALRKEGQREEADAVKALRKPTLAAWALNQLARRQPKEVEGLLAAGEKLRAAQEELLAGGDRRAFQSAAAKERDQVAALAAEAADLAAKAGERASPGLEEKVAATLHAAALDEETGEQLRAGRLLREREAIGGFGGMTAAAPARGRAAPAATSEAPKATEPKRGQAAGRAKRSKTTAGGGARGKAASAEPARRKAGAAEAKRRKAAEDRRRAEAGRRAEAERRQGLAAARTDERHARRALEAAAKAIQHAETRAEAARTHAEEANKRAADYGSSLEGGPTRAGGGQEGTRARRARARGRRARVLGTRRPGGALTRVRSRAACRSPGRR